MKKTIAVILAALMICAVLSACGSEPAAPAADTVSPEETKPAAVPAEITEAADAAEPGFFLTTEYGRLYFAPMDGSDPRLLVDNNAICTVRRGDLLYVSFEDGSIRRVSADGKVNEELAPAGPRNYRKLIPIDGGVIGIYYSFIEGSGYELYRSGSLSPESLFTEDKAVVPGAAGKYLYCHRLGADEESRLEAYDTENFKLVWETQIDSMVEMICDDEGILCFIPNTGKLYRIDEEAQALVPVDIALEKTDCELVLSSGGTCIAEGNWSDDYRSYLINGGSRKLLDTDIPSYYSV